MKYKALDIIEKAFANKIDKAGKPYIEHLKRVADNAKNYFEETDKLDDLETIALLHDLLEDCQDWTIEHLRAIFESSQIVNAVDILTKKHNLIYDQYIKNIAINKFSRAVKLADLKDNMDLTRLSVLTDEDIERVKKYHKSYIYLLKYDRF